jgi:Holliday junction resolvase RusA-like endonuclease
VTKPLWAAWVEGDPKPQPRPRVTRRGHAYNPATADVWKRAIKAKIASDFADCAPLITSLCSLRITFFLPRPKSLKGFAAFPHGRRPDIDNLCKAVMDAMTDAKLIHDDGSIYHLSADKWYAGEDMPAGAKITLWGWGAGEGHYYDTGDGADDAC